MSKTAPIIAVAAQPNPLRPRPDRSPAIMPDANRGSGRKTLRRRSRLMLIAGALTAAVVVPSVYAHLLVAPANTKLPAVSPVPVVGSELNFAPGTWSSATPTTSRYEWLRCPRTGGLDDGSNCTNVSGVMNSPDPFLLSEDDYGHSLRVRETAINTSGSTTVVSAAAETVGHFEGNALGCPSVQAASPIGINEISPPARLQIERQLPFR
jgi:hypothetical protein